jgi:FAD:protein FMN transferase
MRDIPSAKNLALPVLIVVSVFIAQWIRSTEQMPTWHFEGQIMGTTFTVKAVHATEIPLELVTEALEAVNERMSTYAEHSELSLLNQNTTQSPIQISPSLKEVLQASKKVSEDSQGRFDVTVGPMVNAWGFGPNKDRRNPSPELLKTLKARTGNHLWTLGESEVTKLNPKLYIDLSAIAKGYAVDQVVKSLNQANVQRFWVEVGGEIRVKGLNAEGVHWKVGIERPAGKGQRRIFKIINLRNLSIATSGDYRNRYVDSKGMIRSHTIDPMTAEPVKHTLASVSVLHTSCMYADAWATALNVLGPEAGLDMANRLNLAAYFIKRESIDLGTIELDGPKTRYVAILSKSMKQYLEAPTSDDH